MKPFQPIRAESPALRWAVLYAFAVGVVTAGIVASGYQMAHAAESPAKPIAEKKAGVADAELDADQWHVYRGGPAMQGVAPGKLTDKPVLLWKYQTKGSVRSSAVVADGVAFIGSNDGYVHAIRVADGQQAWTFRVGDREAEKANPDIQPEQIEAPPLCHKGVVYIGAGDGVLYAIDAKTGKQRWIYRTDDEISGAPNWTRAPDGKSDWILLGSHDNLLHCVDASTGKKVWTFETDNFINGAPAIDGGKTVFGGCDGYIHIINVADGKKVGQVEIESYIAGTVALRDGKVYTGHLDNRVISADLNQKKVLWKYRDKSFPYHSSPAVDGDFVVIGGRDRRVHCIKASNGDSVWKFRTRDDVDSSPVICDGKVVVGSNDGRVYMLNLKDGQKLWDYEIGKAVTSSPAVVSGRIIIGSDDGYVYCFGSKPGAGG